MSVRVAAEDARKELVVRALSNEEDRRRWDDFVRNSPEGTFFHLSAWKGLLEDVFRHRTFYLLAERRGEIVGVLPLAEVKSRLFGHSFVSLPFCAYGGLIGDDAAAATALESRVETLVQNAGAQYSEFRNLRSRHPEWPRQDLYVTFRREIAQEDDANLRSIPRKQRAMVRKGIARGLCSAIDADASRFFQLYSDNVRRHGTPALPRRFFDELLHRFEDECEVLTVTDPDGRPVSSVLSFYFRGEVLPYYAGDHAAARSLAANDFKYWELMRRAAERGCRVFDFGRSKVGTGPWSFKKNWGFEPQPLYYEYRLYKRETVPQNNPMNPRYKAFIALWRRLPLRLTTALGPHIVRNLG